MPLDPGRWPEMSPDRLLWPAQLRTSSLAWLEEARRLRSTVRSPALSGPCARALWSCADEVAAEIEAVARELEPPAGAPGL
jgi:hypothetical protein